MQIKKKQKSKSGFALLFSILLASFLISLGISIFSISLKQIQISTSLRDSQSAYYAAESALECALYWGTSAQNYFPPCTNLTSKTQCPLQNSPSDSVPVHFSCNGNSIDLTFTDSTDVNGPTTFDTGLIQNFFQASSTSSSTPVADIQITKSFIPNVPSDGTGYVKTTITTWGHNTSIIGRRVERALSKTF